MPSFFDFRVTGIQGEPDLLGPLRGQVVLAVNVASRCGYTPQYTGLERLHGELAEHGFAVVGFPCNQFGAQEPGDAEEIKKFCALNYDVTFPLFAKVDVNGADAHPLFEFLKKTIPGLLGSQAIKWNFTKFLIDREGDPVARYAPQEKPESLRKDIEKVLSS